MPKVNIPVLLKAEKMSLDKKYTLTWLSSQLRFKTFLFSQLIQEGQKHYRFKGVPVN